MVVIGTQPRPGMPSHIHAAHWVQLLLSLGYRVDTHATAIVRADILEALLAMEEEEVTPRDSSASGNADPEAAAWDIVAAAAGTFVLCLPSSPLCARHAVDLLQGCALTNAECQQRLLEVASESLVWDVGTDLEPAVVDPAAGARGDVAVSLRELWQETPTALYTQQLLQIAEAAEKAGGAASTLTPAQAATARDMVVVNPAGVISQLRSGNAFAEACALVPLVVSLLHAVEV